MSQGTPGRGRPDKNAQGRRLGNPLSDSRTDAPCPRRLRKRTVSCPDCATRESAQHSRYEIEDLLLKIKHFKRKALRAHKTDTSFKAMIHATAVLINSR
jgi:hypothetical protein